MDFINKDLAFRFNVRCVAQVVDAFTHNGGTPLRSNVVTIATDSGICHSQIVSGSNRNFQAQNFMANLNYNPPTAEEHPNTLHISVRISACLSFFLSVEIITTIKIQ